MMYLSASTRPQTRKITFKKRTEELLRSCTGTLCGNNDAIAVIISPPASSSLLSAVHEKLRLCAGAEGFNAFCQKDLKLMANCSSHRND